ncbi:hypothetical protein UFOVP84_145 [uncultured Caudovirales phage]|uniref:Uncharacterized protein n=1 Tax=uncultured Caudovirales phage TaxID=2100421 RepID=A0A6J5KY11_9CAUD|nr:hypothetical protein UFOVP84_145 [uncultured Caudovirales phage]
MSVLVDFVPTWIYYVILFAGIGGTLITILFGILIPIQFKLALQVVSTIALVIGSFYWCRVNRRSLAYGNSKTTSRNC